MNYVLEKDGALAVSAYVIQTGLEMIALVVYGRKIACHHTIIGFVPIPQLDLKVVDNVNAIGASAIR